MKKILLGSILLLGGVAQAQNLVQAPLINNTFLINPAVAGNNHDLNIYSGYRNAYTSLEGNPTTTLLAADFKVKNKFGAGVAFGAEQIGIFRNHSLQLSGSYKLQLAQESFLSFGIQGGMFFNSIDMQSLNIESSSDIAITESIQNGTAFNLGMGAHFNWKKLNIGLASGRLLSSGYKFENEDLVVNQMPSFNAFANYDIKVSEQYSLIPVVGVEGLQTSPVLVNANVIVKNVKEYYLGYGYNSNMAHSVMMGFQLKKHLNFNYAYSFGGNGIMQNTNGTHEIGLGFMIKSFKDFGGVDQSAEVDSLLSLTDSLSSKITALEKEVKTLKEELAADKEKNKKIVDLEAQIVEKDKIIKALRDQLKNQATTNKGDADALVIVNGENLEKGSYYLIVESFKTEDRAKNAQVEWKEKGIDVFYVKNEKGTWYYVVTSKYNNKKAAQKGLINMRGSLIKDAWIYQHN